MSFVVPTGGALWTSHRVRTEGSRESNALDSSRATSWCWASLQEQTSPCALVGSTRHAASSSTSVRRPRAAPPAPHVGEATVMTSICVAALRHWKRRQRLAGLATRRAQVVADLFADSASQSGAAKPGAKPPRPRHIPVITDDLAKSFLKVFSNSFINTIERVRTPHLLNVVQNLRTFADRVPLKYRSSIDKAFQTEGFLSFLLSRASVSLLVAKATMSRSPGKPPPAISEVHEQIATVVEELYIAAMLHEEKWDTELKADGKSFMAVATALMTSLADPTFLKRTNVQSAILGMDANPMLWTQYGMDLLGMSIKGMSQVGSKSASDTDKRKVSLLGGDSLYATAQWALANVDSRACRKLIARTISAFSDGQLRKKELFWCLDLSIREYLDIEKTAGVATFFSASSACAALVNEVDDDIAQQLAEFGSDIGLVVGLLKDTRVESVQSSLRMGRMTAPTLLAMEQDPELRVLLERRLEKPGDLEEALERVLQCGVDETMRLVNRIGIRATARLECLEESEERNALSTLSRGVSCVPLAEEADPSCRFSTTFALKVENLRLRAQMLRYRHEESRSRERLQSICEVASGVPSGPKEPTRMVGLGLEFNAQEIDWLLLRGLDRRAPVPEVLELEALLVCIAEDRQEVQRRLLALGDSAESETLKQAVCDVFSAGGKRLRPALCLLVHKMLRPVNASTLRAAASEKVLMLATAVEIIHTASLVHDDILDDADTRRQRQTVHKVFGPAVAVFSGDFLFACASSLVESLEDDEITRLVSLVIEEFGHGELAQGSKKFDPDLTLFQYLRKSFYKTASLLAASCRASAVLSGKPQEVCDVMYSYGFYLGIAFQIADDILDFTGDGEELGKPVVQDLQEGNLTAPVILCLSGNEDLGLQVAPGAPELRKLILGRFSQEGDLDRALQLIDEGNGIDMAYKLAEKFADKALEALMLVAPADSDARQALAGLTKWTVRRST